MSEIKLENLEKSFDDFVAVEKSQADTALSRLESGKVKGRKIRVRYAWMRIASGGMIFVTESSDARKLLIDFRIQVARGHWNR